MVTLLLDDAAITCFKRRFRFGVENAPPRWTRFYVGINSSGEPGVAMSTQYVFNGYLAVCQVWLVEGVWKVRDPETICTPEITKSLEAAMAEVAQENLELAKAHGITDLAELADVSLEMAKRQEAVR